MNETIHQRIVQLRAEGWTWKEVAELTGYSVSQCCRLLTPERYERDRQRQRAYARRRRQIRVLCADCGAPCTRTAGRCRSCARRARTMKGTGPHQQAALKLVAEKGLITNQDLADLLGLTYSEAAQVNARLVRYGLLERPVTGFYRLPRKEPPTTNVP
jgi:Homeodomain-like domain